MEETITINNLKEGDILLFEGKGLLSRKISKYDGSDYSHSGIYAGRGMVYEAITGGVMKNTLKESCKHNKSLKISVRRLIIKPTNMQPVLDRAAFYEKNGNGFAQSQIAILGAIMIARGHRITEASALYIDKILQNAAVELFNFTKRNKEPLICSELVYRCYNEALPDFEDPYTLHLVSGSTTPLNKTNINKDSFISAVYGVNSKIFNPHIFKSPFIEKENIISSDFDKQIDDNLEQELEDLNKKVHESIINEDYDLSKETAQKLKRSMDKFLSAMYFGKKKNGEFTVPENSNKILNSYLKNNANFVTPGDLSRATNLQKLGDLDLEKICKKKHSIK